MEPPFRLPRRRSKITPKTRVEKPQISVLKPQKSGSIAGALRQTAFPRAPPATDRILR
jgi:hypothetical protein